MNTTKPNEDLFADFFSVTGGLGEYLRTPKYRKVPKAYANLNKSIRERIIKLGVSNDEVSTYYDEFIKEGNRDINKFEKWVKEKIKIEKNKIQVSQEPITDELINQYSASETEEEKPNPISISPVYIAIGVVALVGVTILIVRK